MKILRGISSLILALCLALGCVAMAEVTFDPAEYTTEELREIQKLVRDALDPDASFTGDELVIYDENGITVTVTGWTYDEEYGELTLNVIVENKSDTAIAVSLETTYLNDWEVYFGGYAEADAGKKCREEFYCYTEDDTGITTEAELEVLEFTLSISDPETYDTIYTSETITFNF